MTGLFARNPRLSERQKRAKWLRFRAGALRAQIDASICAQRNRPVHRLHCEARRPALFCVGPTARSRNNTRRREMRSGQKERGTTMRIERRNTTDGQSPYAGIDFRLTTSEIRTPGGSVVFRLENVEVPEFWSQVASDVLAQKYFR